MRPSALFLFLLLWLFGLSLAWGFSYSGRLAFNSWQIGPPQQVAVQLGPTSTSCAVSWVSLANRSREDDIVYYDSQPDFAGDNASNFYAWIEYGFGYGFETEESEAGEALSSLAQGISAPLMEEQLGYASLYTENRCGTTRLMNSVVVEGCVLGAPFSFRVRSLQMFGTTLVPANNYSEVFTAVVPSLADASPLNVAMIADMSAAYPGGNCIGSVSSRVEAGAIDLVFHMGDIAYDVDDDCGWHGDDFFRQVQNISGRVPYVWGVGDHEGFRKDLADDCHMQLGYDYEGYRMRMGEATWAGQLLLSHASGSPTTFYFSFETRWVHWAVINTNAYVYACQYWMLRSQYRWLEEDLRSVDRQRTPWVVVLGHRGIYCTKNNDTECNQESQSLRYGVPLLAYQRNINIGQWNGTVKGQQNQFGLEQLLDKWGVDFYFCGHTHHYERTWPVVDEVVTQHDYTRPKAPFYVQGGLSGEDPDPFAVPQAAWESYRDEQLRISWGQATFFNATHLRWQQIAANDSSVFDEFWVVK